tara:strand:+ start:2704 stop:3468 length:765 start_codon:yes stop_codon:yes gene_type:complete
MSNLFLKSDGPNPSIGQDIDQRYFEMNGKEYGDYEVLKQPRIGGGNFLLPNIQGDSIDPPTVNRSQIDNPDRDAPGDGTPGLGNTFESQTMDSVISEINNGRMPDLTIGGLDIDTKEEYIIRNDNQNTSIKGIVEQSGLNILFFSPENIKALQDMIRYYVYKQTNKVISYQSENDIYIIMRSIILQYGNFRTTNYLDDIRKLNGMVVEYSVNDISSKVMQQISYVNDLTKLPTPLDLPRYENKQNFTYDISNLI